jgi:hypothetical protein
VGIDHVSFYRNGTLLNTQHYRPYSCVWDTTKVADGSSYTLRAVASDEHGNSASASVRVRVRNAPAPDITAPQTTITAGPSGASGSSSASFSFSSSEAGSSFQCSLDAGPWASCASPKAYTGLADGDHSFGVRATDGAGNTDLTPASRSFTVDTSAPDTTITAGPSGTINTSSAIVSFSSSEVGSSFQCSLDAGSWASCSSPKAYTGLADGNHSFEVRATDGAGNTDATPDSRSFTVEAPPDTTIDSGPAGTVNSPNVSFTFSSSRAGSSFECSLDAGPWAACASPKAYTGLADGDHSFGVRATDGAGNTDLTPAIRSFTVDTSAPDPTITAGPSGTINTSSAIVSFSSSEAGSSFQCSLDAGSWASCSSPKAYTGLADGNHSFEVRATDGAGNTDATPDSRSFTVDTSSPGGDGYPSLIAVDYDGDFDPGCQLIGGQGGWSKNESGTDYPGTASVSTTVYQEGGCAAKFSTPAGPNPSYVDNPMSRAEVQAPTLTGSSSVSVVWEQLFYIPSEANNGPYYGELSQTKDNNAQCYGGGLRLSRADQHLKFVTVASCSATAKEWDIGPVPRDRWFAVKVVEDFSDSGSIHVSLDPDGTGPSGYAEEIPPTNADTAPATPIELKLRQGLYHREDQHESHVWGDGFHVHCLSGC